MATNFSIGCIFINNKFTRRLATQADDASVFVVDIVKICLTSSLITMQNLVVVSHTVCVHAGGSKNLGMLGPTFGMLGWGVDDPIDNTLPFMCYRTKFRRCRSSHFRAGRGSQKIFGTLWMWVCLTP